METKCLWCERFADVEVDAAAGIAIGLCHEHAERRERRVLAVAERDARRARAAQARRLP